MLTKQDLTEISELLNKSALKDSLDRLTATNNDLVDKVGEIDVKVSALDEKFTKETRELRSEQELLATFSKNLDIKITDYKTETDNALEDLREEIKRVSNQGDTQKLSRKVERLEKSVHHGQQHDRLWNLEIVGIPVNVGHEPDQLEEAALSIFEAINVNCGPDNIEAIHRLKSKENRIPVTILCIDSRKIVRDIHKNKHKLKNLQDLNIDIAGLTEDSKIFINPSLTPYSRSLAYNCRLLRNDRLIEKVRIDDDGAVKIKFFGKDEHERIHVESDLHRLFPDYKEFSFDQ